MLLETREVDFSYPDGTRALSGISIGFARGRRTAVLGRNGAGKSSLFTLLNGIERPTRGTVLFDGAPLDYSRAGLRRLRSRVGLVFQDPDAQLFSASVREDVSFGPLNLGLAEEEVRRRVEEALQAVGLAELAERPTHALSYGEKKRACIAGVLAMRPELLVLDEPTAGLDQPMSRELLALLNDLHGQGLTIVLATHDVDFAYAWADDIRVLEKGRLGFQAAAADAAAARGGLPPLGLEVPLVFELAAALKDRGVLPEDCRPRCRDELLMLLKGQSS